MSVCSNVSMLERYLLCVGVFVRECVINFNDCLSINCCFYDVNVALL